MSEPCRAVIGSKHNFWLHSPVHGFDLTHPLTPESPLIYPRLPLQTTTSRLVVDPGKTCLVVVDMQNFFLSPCLGRPKDGNGLKACNKLLKFAIPACRKGGIRIIWLNWGLTQQDLNEMPPATIRAFGFEVTPCDKDFNMAGTAHESFGANHGAEHAERNLSPKAPFRRDPRLYRGLGTELGLIESEDGTIVDGGRLLMRDTWNAALYAPLEKARQESLNGKLEREDIWIHKNRLSGLWGTHTDCTKYLLSMGIRTLLFAGVNTDQCVVGSMQDAFTKGWDCLLLSDGSGTTSPNHSQECVEYNTAKTLGFVLSCENLAKGVEKMERA